ncbi:MAG: hypothetical protein IKO25_07245 [Clostridia bacterium]|nr:hypothetical protein [Clostridia bacterium]
MDPKIIINRPENFDQNDFHRIGKAPTATVEEGQVIDLEMLYHERHYFPVYEAGGRRGSVR